IFYPAGVTVRNDFHQTITSSRGGQQRIPVSGLPTSYFLTPPGVIHISPLRGNGSTRCPLFVQDTSLLFDLPTSGIRYPSDIRHRTSDIRHPSSSLPPKCVIIKIAPAVPSMVGSL